MSTKFTKGPIDGVIIKKLTRHLDRRGSLCETFRSDEFPTGFIPAMSYISYTEPGISRGPHEHKDQTDLFAMPGPGNLMLKMWDNRTTSPTYGKYMELYAGKDNPITVIIPPVPVIFELNIIVRGGIM